MNSSWGLNCHLGDLPQAILIFGNSIEVQPLFWEIPGEKTWKIQGRVTEVVRGLWGERGEEKGEWDSCEGHVNHGRVYNFQILQNGTSSDTSLTPSRIHVSVCLRTAWLLIPLEDLKKNFFWSLYQVWCIFVGEKEIFMIIMNLLPNNFAKFPLSGVICLCVL